MRKKRANRPAAKHRPIALPTNPPAPPIAKSAPPEPTAPPAEPSPGRGWFTKQSMAEIFAVSEQHFDRSIRPLAPTDGIRSIDRRIWFDARKLIDAWSIAQHPPSESSPLPPLLDGPKSPALEKLRGIYVEQEQIKLDELRGRSIAKDLMEPALARFAMILRSAGESLQRLYGDDAAAVLNEAVDEAEAAWSQMFAPAAR